MRTTEQIRDRVFELAQAQGLGPQLLTPLTQVITVGDTTLVDIVVSDRSRLADVNEVADLLSEELKRDSVRFSLVIRSAWEIESLGEIGSAYGPSGGLRAAALVPVFVKSGSQVAQVTVSITKKAEMQFEWILGRKVDLKEVARIVILGELRKGGRSFWDPLTENYLEVAAGDAPNLSRMLKRSA